MVTQPVQLISNATAIADLAKETVAGKVWISGFGELSKTDVISVTKAEASDPVQPVSTLLLAKVVAGAATDIFRIKIVHVSLDADSGFTSSNSMAKEKASFVEFTQAALGSATKATNLAAYLNRQIANSRLGKEIVFEKGVDTAGSESLLVKGIMKECGEYAGNTIPKVVLEKVIPIADYTIIPSTEVEAVATVTTEGKPGFGTYLSFLRTNRFPTDANTAFGAQFNGGDMPIRGQKYDQYIITINQDRGPIGDAKFAENVTLCRDLIIWVPTTLSAAFKTLTDKLTATE